MGIESALATEIKSIAEVAAIISDRVYPVVAPQNSAIPFVTYRRIPGDVEYTQNGEASMQKGRFQLAAVCENYEQVIELASKLRAGLSGKRGLLGDGSVKSGGIFFRGPDDDWNRETGLFVRTQECAINFQVV